MLLQLCIFFFFKQKTAYEMRISDWSSDVCSSDLKVDQGSHHCQGRGQSARNNQRRACRAQARRRRRGNYCRKRLPVVRWLLCLRCHGGKSCSRPWPSASRPLRRSEEHTSELQSQMRIAYAVFRVQKKR